MIVIGYLSGLVPGAVVSIVGGLALMTFGRALLLDRVSGAVSGAALAVAAGALGVGALRWGTLEIEGIIGAQSVLGPTVLVAPTAAAAASSAAMAAGVLALGVWSSEPLFEVRGAKAWGVFEVILAVLAVIVAFAVPATGGGTGLGGLITGLGRDPLAAIASVGGLVAAVGVVLAISRFLPRPVVWRWGVLGVTGAAVATAAAIMASVL